MQGLWLSCIIEGVDESLPEIHTTDDVSIVEDAAIMRRRLVRKRMRKIF